MENTMYSKQWDSNLPKAAEATILLDLVQTIYRKSKHIEIESMVLYTNKQILSRRINNPIPKPNLLAMNAGVEIAQIKDIIEKVVIKIVVEWTREKPKIIKPFIEDPAPDLITICYKKVDIAQKNIDQQLQKNNIKYHGYYIVLKEGILRLRGVKEMIRIADTKKIE